MALNMIDVYKRQMLPKNIIAKDSLTRLHIYRGGEHEHAAQKPQVWDAE